jgi:hypothetical protein
LQEVLEILNTKAARPMRVWCWWITTQRRHPGVLKVKLFSAKRKVEINKENEADEARTHDAKSI